MNWSWRRFSISTGVFDYTIRQQMVGTDGLGKRDYFIKLFKYLVLFQDVFKSGLTDIQEHLNGFKKFNGFKSVDV